MYILIPRNNIDLQENTVRLYKIKSKMEQRKVILRLETHAEFTSDIKKYNSFAYVSLEIYIIFRNKGKFLFTKSGLGYKMNNAVNYGTCCELNCTLEQLCGSKVRLYAGYFKQNVFTLLMIAPLLSADINEEEAIERYFMLDEPSRIFLDTLRREHKGKRDFTIK
jgi:hypothetical protein